MRGMTATGSLPPSDHRADAALSRPPDAVDLARDALAAKIEAAFPGITVQHGLYGWIARRDGEELARGQSHVALLALLPYVSDPDAP
jgi:hypothetical protein